MLQNVSVPVAALAAIKPRHCPVLLGLLAFADRDGKCWPSLRKLAEVTGLTLSKVQRAVAELVEAGHIKRRSRGRRRSAIYQITGRFLPTWPKRESQNQDSRSLANPPPTGRSTDAESPISATLKDSQEVKHQGTRWRARGTSQHSREGGGDGLPDEGAQWRARLRSWAKSGGKFWLANWGPKPDEPGCYAPRSILATLTTGPESGPLCTTQ